MKSIATEKRGLYITAILLVAVCLVAFFAGRYLWLNDQKIPVKVLILPKFEVGELTGDFPGEAQLFYEEYVADGDVYEIAGDKLYYRDGVALFTTREGKVNAALGTAAVLSDERFDFSDAYVMSVGLAVKRFGLLDRLIILRVAVNMDNFPSGVTPEMLWGPKSDDHISSENSMESVDIFETAMHNCFDAGKIVIDAILEGEL